MRELTKGLTDIYAAKGQRVIHLNMKADPPDDLTIAELLVGPTGKLRAPTLRKGKTLIVGFDADTYEQILG